MALITPETARSMSEKGLEARRAKAETVKNRLALIDKLLEQAAKTTVQTAKPAEPIIDNAHAIERLKRVRKQLDRVDRMMLEETDPSKLDRLASAQARLSEQERILAGRPLPGSFRPQQERSSRSKGRPVEVWSEPATPQPVVSSVSAQVPPQIITTPPVQGPENG